MAIPKFLEDLLIISKLGDNPGSDNGLSSSGLRAKFDEAGVKIQQYINNTLIPALSELADPTAGLNMKGNISMGGHRVTGVGNPVEGGDVVPLGYAGQHFAPAGYGLGGSNGENIPKITDCNTVFANGWYRVRGAVNVPTNGTGGSPHSYGWMLVSTGDFTRQDFYTSTTDPQHWERYYVDGVWDEWSCKNPPMLPGTEYRTTERYNGKPVYAKLVQTTVSAHGSMDSYDTFSFPHGIANFENLVRHFTKYNGSQLPTFNLVGGFFAVQGVTSENVAFMLYHNDISGGTMEVELHYTKSV